MSLLWKGVYKTWKTYCFDAETGERIWDLTGTGTGYGYADGYMVYLQYNDLQIYCIGKGPSATTVTAAPEVSMHGSNVLLKGMVTDISAGTNSDLLTSRFPNGVPAVSDESMSRYMEYVYMQMPKPSEVEGVEVVVSVLDPNNNFYEVGRTTSDVNGFYKLAFEPLVPGEYTVYASFEGSESYWPSQAVTAISVEEAPAATAPPTPPPATAADLYFVPATAGIIVAIVVVGIVLILMLRRS